MDTASNIPCNIRWINLNDFILSLGNIPTLSQFAATVLTGLREFLPFDRALAYFYDGNGKIRDRYLLDYNKRWSQIYMEYYAQMRGIESATPHNVLQNMSSTEVYNRACFGITDWTKLSNHEFITDYIRASDLKYSLHFQLFDTKGVPRVLYALDRLTNMPFTHEEIEIARFVIPHLNNLNKKYYFLSGDPDNLSDRKSTLMEMAGLTKREKEITLQLCNGVSPANIGKMFHITLATTHKHIAHIYEKLRVSNLQELLVYLLNPHTSLD